VISFYGVLGARPFFSLARRSIPFELPSGRSDATHEELNFASNVNWITHQPTLFRHKPGAAEDQAMPRMPEWTTTDDLVIIVFTIAIIGAAALIVP